MYIIIALTMIIFSALAVTSRKILRAATYLLFALFGTAALYFSLDYEFLGAVQIAVYAGGIVVLFVFAILLTSKPGHHSETLTSKSTILGMFAAALMALVCGAALISRCQLFATKPEMLPLDMKSLGLTLLGSSDGGLLLPFEALGVLLLACIIGGVVIARKR